MDREFEYLKQKIASNIEQRKMFWTIEVVVGGGITTILTSPNSYAKMVLIILGIILFFIFFNEIKRINRNLNCLFKRMKGLKNDTL